VLCAYTNTTLQLVASSGESSSASYTAKGAVPATGGTVAESSSYTHYSGDAAGYIMQPAAQRDTDSDGLLDSYEQTIIDADLGDAIDSLDGVLPGDDFDGDGRTNLQEQNDGTDPTDADSYRSSPPASLAGKAYQFSSTDGFSTSVPWEIVFNETTYNLGFSGSIISQDVPYTYSNGELWLWRGDRVWVTFDSAKAGTYVKVAGVDDTEDDDTTVVSPASIITNESLVSAIVQHEFQTIYTSSLGVDTTGTFSQVTPTLTLKNDWQRNETMDSVLLTDYWNVWSRSVDSLAYSGGALNFLFADGGDSANYDHPEIKIEYGRALPMDENWQVQLNDIDVSASVEQFDIALDFGVGAADFRCDLGYGDYGSGRGVAVWIRNGDRFGYAEALSVNNDALIANNLNLRVTHTASSRELRFEYQSVGASGWNELARLNLETGACTSGYWMYGEGFSGQLFSSSERLSLEIDAESGQATQFGDLKIGGIEIGSYTPPQEAHWEPAGWVYYSWPYAYDFTEGRWHFFNQSDKQWRVNLSDSEWATLDAATGWNYYAWPYSYSSDQGAWHWYNSNIQWVIDLVSGEWELFGGSD
jgi:hypothetical protein